MQAAYASWQPRPHRGSQRQCVHCVGTSTTSSTSTLTREKGTENQAEAHRAHKATTSSSHLRLIGPHSRRLGLRLLSRKSNDCHPYRLRPGSLVLELLSANLRPIQRSHQWISVIRHHPVISFFARQTACSGISYISMSVMALRTSHSICVAITLKDWDVPCLQVDTVQSY